MLEDMGFRPIDDPFSLDPGNMSTPQYGALEPTVMAALPTWQLPPEPIVSKTVDAWNEVCGCGFMNEDQIEAGLYALSAATEQAFTATHWPPTGSQTSGDVHWPRHVHEHVLQRQLPTIAAVYQRAWPVVMCAVVHVLSQCDDHEKTTTHAGSRARHGGRQLSALHDVCQKHLPTRFR